MTKLDARQEADLARSLEATPELLPLLPDLLCDLWDLGSWPARIVELLRPLDLPVGPTRVLELGCGKGAVAICIARELGFQVVGVDLLPAFLLEADERAAAHGVAELCRFQRGDLRDMVCQARGFDVVVLASVGDVLGPLAACVDALRHTVRAGGFLVIDEGFLSAADTLDSPGYESCVSHEEALRQLTSHGESLLAEVITPAHDLQAMNQRYMTSIRRRADDLAERWPQHAEAVRWYVRNQERECRVLERHYTGATWLLQRGPRDGQAADDV